ncbi:ThuA domain-containing protein [Occultella glacieicola]|uniref:ThuA domain-containing protein n=1 Tax=Occultella glacieicola TaxID=2518684 RepID=A0ABY2E908_9MICO|nr:ThuA domain-containing protein [Occultella glacieicola]TDE95760.1 ThuA domain-containing protein [Occultella glacieicola]
MPSTQNQPNAVVLSGAGRYADPWHDFDGTSAALAELLDGLGVRARVLRTDEVTSSFEGIALLVVNAGGGSTPAPELAPGGAREAVLEHADSGGPVLATHTASNTFFETPDWAHVLGGRWVPGLSMHPPLDTTVVRVAGTHPVTDGLSDFEATDERYSYLETSPDVTVLVTHAHDERAHPLVWARERSGARVIYDAFGHDRPAYAQPGRVDLLRREVDWLLGRTDRLR